MTAISSLGAADSHRCWMDWIPRNRNRAAKILNRAIEPHPLRAAAKCDSNKNAYMQNPRH